MHRVLRSVVCALFLALVSGGTVCPATPAAAQETDSFAADLEACQELVARRSWKNGREAYEKLLEEYAEDPRAVAAVAGIERDLQLCLFNLGRRLPTGEALFGPHVEKFSASGRRLEMVFPNGIQDVPWEDFSGQMRTLPMRFTDDVVVTIPADGSKTRFSDDSTYDNEDQVRVRALLAMNLELSGGYLAIPPYTFRSGSVGDYQHDADPSYPFPTDFRVFDLAESPPKLLKKDYWWGKTRGKPRCRWVRVSQKGGLIKIDAEGCKSFGVRDNTHDGGYLAVSADWVRGDSTRPISIRVQGELDRTYLSKAIAQHEDAAFQQWKTTEYDRETVLPEWIRKGVDVTASASVALPSDLPDEHRENVEAFLEWMLSDETTTDMDLPDPSVLPPLSSALVAGALSLMRGELLHAEERFSALLESDPTFHAALLWRARSRYYRRDVEGAASDMSAAAEHLSDDPGYHEMVVNMLLMQGDLEGARDALSTARGSSAWTRRLEDLAVGVEAAARGPHWRRTFRKKTRHFEILSDHSQEMCQDVGNVLSDAVRRFAKTFRTIPETRHPARVFVFSSRDAYATFAKEVGSSLTHSAGAYLPRLHILVIWMPKDRRDFEATVRHEGFHQYVHHFIDDLPLWFNEGYAEYFGNIPHESRALGHETDREEMLRRVKRYSSDFVPLPELMKMSRSQFMSNASPRYTQAWAAVTMLHEGEDELRGRLERYFEALLAGRSPAEAYDEVYAEVEETLLARWQLLLASSLLVD